MTDVSLDFLSVIFSPFGYDSHLGFAFPGNYRDHPRHRLVLGVVLLAGGVGY